MKRVDVNTGTRALGDAIASLFDAPVQVAAALTSGFTRAGAPGCEIPPPCWEPRPAGTCTLELPPGCAGTVRVHVSNCDWTPRVLSITALGKLAGWLKFEPTSLVLGPQERAPFLVTARVPDNATIGQRLAGPLIIRGCLFHYVRLDIRVTECAGCTGCDVEMNDCQDHVHHWYDHFYCPRPCQTDSTRDVTHG